MTHPPAPDLFDSKYLLVGDIREGGMSTVQMAYEPTTKRKCAIKRMLTDRKEWPHWKESFYREAKALSDLSEHENIVDLYGSGSDDQGCHYLVLEWLPQTLQAFIEKNGPLNWDDFYAKFGRPILRGLVYAQSRNWTHRDIKPSNILLSEHNLPKITDFGIARQLGTPDLGLTLRHFLSVRFSPPEDDLLYRYSRDCFSWAAVALYCLTANLPRTYPELAALLDAVDPDMAPLRILESCLSLTANVRHWRAHCSPN